MAVGIGWLVSSKDNWLWATLFTVVGTLLLLDNLNVLVVDVWRLFWPIVVIGVGLAVLFSGSKTKISASKAKRSDVVAILGGNKQTNDSSDFVASKITSVMGGAVLDLRKAKIQKEAVIEVIAFWGGIEIYLPKDVAVKNEIFPILGGVENKTDSEVMKNAPTITIIGQAIMGGVEIRN